MRSKLHSYTIFMKYCLIEVKNYIHTQFHDILSK